MNIFNDHLNEYKNNPIRKLLQKEDTIFHYCKLNIGLEQILYKNTFKFSEFEKTNDPLEYKKRKFLFSGHRDIIQKENTLNRFIKEKAKFASFCQNKNLDEFEDRYFAYSKSRMWSQYGENHQGLCLALSLEKIINKLDKKYQKSIILNDYIHYDIKIDIDEYEVEEEINFDNSGLIKYCNKYKKALFFKKNIDYISEDEYRIVVISDNPVEIKLNDEILVGVLIGDSFPDIYHCVIEKLQSIYPKTIFNKISWSNGNPSIEGISSNN